MSRGSQPPLSNNLQLSLTAGFRRLNAVAVRRTCHTQYSVIQIKTSVSCLARTVTVAALSVKAGSSGTTM